MKESEITRKGQRNEKRRAVYRHESRRVHRLAGRRDRLAGRAGGRRGQRRELRAVYSRRERHRHGVHDVPSAYDSADAGRLAVCRAEDPCAHAPQGRGGAGGGRVYRRAGRRAHRKAETGAGRGDLDLRRGGCGQPVHAAGADRPLPHQRAAGDPRGRDSAV